MSIGLDPNPYTSIQDPLRVSAQTLIPKQASRIHYEYLPNPQTLIKHPGSNTMGSSRTGGGVGGAWR